MHGAAGLVADFSKATIKATLTGLATLDGTIDTNTFSGTKATVIAEDTENPHGLDMAGTFMGSFSGGFYGAKAAEAGWCFRLHVGRCRKPVRSVGPLVVTETKT